MTHINVQTVLDYLSVVGKQDFAAAGNFFANNVEYNVAGRNRFSGTFYGAHEVMGYFGKMMAISQGSYKVVEFKDWLVSDDKAMTIAAEEVTINDKVFNWNRLLLFEFDENKKMKRISFYDEDQYAFDEFLG